MKRWNAGMLQPMQQIQRLMEQSYGGSVGQATQLVVGAADESDWDIHLRQRHHYRELHFKRIYYSAFRPIKYTPLEEHPPTPLIREHRLYQLDWLTRIYEFTDDELKLAFDDGFLDQRADPKLRIAVEQLDRFPMDINHASQQELIRVPGIGPTAAERIVRQRRAHLVDNQRDLQAMGVVLKRALRFIRFPGHKPVRAKQGMLPLFESLSADPAPQPGVAAPQPRAAALHQQHATAGCASCPLNPGTCGMPKPATASSVAPMVE
jgi:predicted DNA-binding helix-hairpin-helix protein